MNAYTRRPVTLARRLHGRHRSLAAALAVAIGLIPSAAHAADATWNAFTSQSWDLASPNWSTGVWDNAAGNAAVLGFEGADAINVGTAINVSSINVKADGYVFNGPGSINLVGGTGTLASGIVNVGDFATNTAVVNVPITSSVGFRKTGVGTLVLAAPINVTGAIPLGFSTTYKSDFFIGVNDGSTFDGGGTVKLSGSNVLASSTRVGIARGYLDIGTGTQTIGALVLTNNVSNSAIPWDTVNGINGITGTGTLKVDGEIEVFGQNLGGGNLGNSITSNLDLGGKSQIIRVGRGGSIPLPDYSPLIITGTVSNGSLFKTVGTVAGSTIGGSSGIGLFGNNTYTGESIFNGGGSAIAGTNATTTVTTSGVSSSLTLFGANGSILSATTVRAVAGATFTIDNTVVLPLFGTGPTIPAAQNNDRVRDDVVLTLRDGSFTYKGLASTAATETIGGIALTGGNAVVTLTPGTSGSVGVTLAGDLTLASRASLTITGNTLGGNAKLLVGGAKPAADATGIFNNIVSTTDFLTYNGTTGFTPLATYATDLSTPGTNVTLAAAPTLANDATVNALKRSATFTLTIPAGKTLTLASGMLLSASGTATTAGGTLAVGSAPLRLWGTNTISSAVTGSAGLIAASGTQTLSGDLSGLSGSLDINAATVTLTTSTFKGDMNVRAGTLNLNVSQNGAVAGKITVGVGENAVNQLGLTPTLSVSSAPANSVFNNNIVFDNGARSAGGLKLSYSLLAKFFPLSNSSGSQTFNGNITLNSDVNFQGGGGGGTGATIFNGNISGPGQFVFTNGRATFGATGNISNADGFLIGQTGFTSQLTFLGTASGNGPITVSGGNSVQLKYVAGSLPGGKISVINSSTTIAPVFYPLNDSTLNNTMSFDGPATVDVASGVNATWAGPMSGTGPITKKSAGTLNFTNTSYAITGGIDVQAGTLAVRRLGVLNGNTNVAAGATLKISPGASFGDVAATTVFNDTTAVLTLAGGTSPTATLDIGKQAVIFDYSTASLDSKVRSQLLSGRNGGTWTGTGITSSAAAANSAYAVGYGEAGEFSNLASTLVGQPFDATSILVRYTLKGDANLDGAVNFDDLLALAQNYGSPTPSRWSMGDFDYSGAVDFDDLLALAQNYSAPASLTGGFASDWALAQSLTPEPTGLLLVAGLAGLARRRSRR